MWRRRTVARADGARPMISAPRKVKCSLDNGIDRLLVLRRLFGSHLAFVCLARQNVETILRHRIGAKFRTGT
jgi:hypothetical protein